MTARTTKGYRGVNLSGNEFTGSFQGNTRATYDYFKAKGLTLIRLPFEWYEVQPTLNEPLDETEMGYLDTEIEWARLNKMKVILDMHNYGKRKVYKNGGFTDDFSSGTQTSFRLPYGDHDSGAGTLTIRDFGRAIGGTAQNPVAPADSYKFTVTAKINSVADAASEIIIEVYRTNDNNRYYLAINPTLDTWALRKVVLGVQTTLGSGSKTWDLGTYYTFIIDVGQATADKINVKVDGVDLYLADSINTDPALTRGFVALFPAGVNATFKDVELNVDGDTSSGGVQEAYIDTAYVPIDAYKDAWTRISKRYKNVETVFGYDHNEPQNMPVPTSPTNYSEAVAAANGVPVATATKMHLAMRDAVRANGDDKYLVVELDYFANLHRFEELYGENPEPWIPDTLMNERVIYSAHYYFDPDHSGTYGDLTVPSEATVRAEAEPLLKWCRDNNKICLIGEYGVPNSSSHMAILDYFLDLLDQYDAWATHWAGGDIYSSTTTIQPTSSYTVDRLQMSVVQEHLQYQQWEREERPHVSDRWMDVTDTWEDYDKQWEDNWTATERPGSPVY